MNYGQRFVTLYRKQGERPSPRKRNAKKHTAGRQAAGQRELGAGDLAPGGHSGWLCRERRGELSAARDSSCGRSRREPRPVGGAAAWSRPLSGSSEPARRRPPAAPPQRQLAPPSPPSRPRPRWDSQCPVAGRAGAGGEARGEGGPWPQRAEGALRRAERRWKARETSGGGA